MHYQQSRLTVAFFASSQPMFLCLTWSQAILFPWQPQALMSSGNPAKPDDASTAADRYLYRGTPEFSNTYSSIVLATYLDFAAEGSIDAEYER